MRDVLKGDGVRSSRYESAPRRIKAEWTLEGERKVDGNYYACL
jgi:hypothetical protein